MTIPKEYADHDASCGDIFEWLPQKTTLKSLILQVHWFLGHNLIRKLTLQDKTGCVTGGAVYNVNKVNFDLFLLFKLSLMFTSKKSLLLNTLSFCNQVTDSNISENLQDNTVHS